MGEILLLGVIVVTAVASAIFALFMIKREIWADEAGESAADETEKLAVE